MKKFNTPVNAITFEIILGIILMIISDPNKLSEISVFTIYIFYVMTFVGVFILRKRNEGKERAYTVPLFPIVPIVAIFGSLFVIGSAIMNDPISCFLSIGIVVTGLPVYWYLNKKKRKITLKKQVKESLASLFVKHFLLEDKESPLACSFGCYYCSNFTEGEKVEFSSIYFSDCARFNSRWHCY